jgi:hypothetical protein
MVKTNVSYSFLGMVRPPYLLNSYMPQDSPFVLKRLTNQPLTFSASDVADES